MAYSFLWVMQGFISSTVGSPKCCGRPAGTNGAEPKCPRSLHVELLLSVRICLWEPAQRAPTMASGVDTAMNSPGLFHHRMSRCSHRSRCTRPEPSLHPQVGVCMYIYIYIYIYIYLFIYVFIYLYEGRWRVYGCLKHYKP